MTVRVFTSFEAIAAELRSQLSYPNERRFLLSVDWFELLFTTCLAGTGQPRIYVVCGADGQVLCALFCIVPAASPRALLSLTNFYSTEYLASLAPAAQPDQGVATLFTFIARERPRWVSLRLSMLTDGPTSQAVFDAVRREGFRAQRFHQYENWHASVAGESFEHFYSQRPSQLRNTIARKQKKLEKQHQLALRFSTTPVHELETLVRDFNTVYAASWKQPEPFPDFIPALAARCAALGVLRLGVLYVDGVAAAAQLWITAGRRAVIYKLAYDEKFAPLGVGSILSRELFRIALDEDHVDEIDYGVGGEAYKKDWMTAVRNIQGIEAYNPRTAVGLMLGTWMGAKASLKKWRPARAATEPAR